MLQFSKFKVTIILGIILLGIVFSAPNLVPADKLASLPSWVPKTVISLGLDLQGGSHLLYEVDTKEFLNDRLDAVVSDIRDKLTKGETRFGYVNLQASNGVVSLTLRDPNQIEAARPLLREATQDMELDIASDGKVTKIELRPAALPFYAADDDLLTAPPERFELPTQALGRPRSIH